MHPDLQALHDYYEQVIDGYQAGTYTYDQALAAVAAAAVEDSAGNVWSIDPSQGTFLRTAPGKSPAPASSADFVGAPVATSLAPQTPAPSRRRLFILLGVVAIGMLAFVFFASTSKSPAPVTSTTIPTTQPPTTMPTTTLPGATSTTSLATTTTTSPSTPSAPTSLSTQIQGSSLTVAWASVTNATSYTVSTQDGTVVCTTPTTSCTATLAPATYVITVTATNDVGTSPTSQPVTVSITSTPTTTTPPATTTTRPAPSLAPPRLISATPGPSRVSVTWASVAGATSYQVQSLSASASCASRSTSCVLSGLVNGRTYSVHVRAKNAHATSPWSSPLSATPVAPPSSPRSLVATQVSRTTEVTLSWATPTSTGGSSITHYVALATPSGLGCTSATTSCLVSGLTLGTSYTFTVSAYNAAGASTPSTPSSPVTLVSVPDAPLAPSPQINGSSVTLSWSPPFAAGSPITSYIVASTPPGLGCTSATTSCLVSGLTLGTSYTFTVSATNSVGTSPPSPPSNAVRYVTAPSPPKNLTVSLPIDATQAALSWATPDSSGGEPITTYVVTSSPPGIVCHVQATSCVTSTLRVGTSYTFVVAATNSVGTSPTSPASSPVKIRLSPSAPRSLSASVAPKATTLKVSWLAPLAIGTAPLDHYLVTANPGAHSCSSTTTSCVVSGLSFGTAYSLRVVAVTSVATSPAATSARSYTPFTSASAPTKVHTSTLNIFGSYVYVDFSAPASSGGSPVTSYKVTLSGPKTLTCVTSTLSCRIAVSSKTTYSVSVVAINAAGAGSPSAPIKVTSL